MCPRKHETTGLFLLLFPLPSPCWCTRTSSQQNRASNKTLQCIQGRGKGLVRFSGEERGPPICRNCGRSFPCSGTVRTTRARPACANTRGTFKAKTSKQNARRPRTNKRTKGQREAINKEQRGDDAHVTGIRSRLPLAERTMKAVVFAGRESLSLVKARRARVDFLFSSPSAS